MRTARFSIVLAAVMQSACSEPIASDTVSLDQKVHAAYLKATSGIDAPVISAETVLAHVQEGKYILVDVREDKEIAVSHIPGSLSPDAYARTYGAGGPPKDKVVIAYCTIGYRSGKFTEKLMSKGVPAKNMEGGILAWVGRHGPLVQQSSSGISSPTTKVHVYGKEWNLVPPGYQSTW